MSRRSAGLALLLVCLALAVPSHATCPVIHRSAVLIREFKRTHVCPSTGTVGTGPCPGWVVDHGLSLCLVGQEGDVSWNLFYQEVEAAKKKDALERKVCRRLGCAHRGD
jgi:hypothetical protein